MAQGKASPGDRGKRPPKASARVQGSTRAPVDGAGGAGGGKANDEMEGLFVDPAPDSKRSARAADRRRERGLAPEPAGKPDTRMSLPQAQQENPQRAAGSQMSALNPHLQCTRGPEEGLSLNLIEGSYTIGRARENSFVLKDIAASRKHLRIDVDSRGARVVDLGSGNGTRVNGKRITEHELKNGDRIEIGGSVLQFVEKGAAPANAPDSGVDDAQERVIRAAEKLAAELSQRMHFDNGSQAALEDGHVAKTQAIPKLAKDKLTEEIKRQQQQRNGNGNGNGAQHVPKAEKLWKETFTNLPLNQVIAADQPLRGPRTAESVQPPPAAVNNDTRNPLPRPQPLPVPALPDDADYSGSTSRGGGSFVMSLLVTTLVVVLGGGLVITFYALTRNRGGDEMTQPDAQAEYDRAMQKCLEAYSGGEWLRSHEYATLALQLMPNDVMAKRYQADSRERIDAATRGGASLPSPTGLSLTPPTPAPPAPNLDAPSPSPVPSPTTTTTTTTTPVGNAAALPAPVSTAPAPAPSPPKEAAAQKPSAPKPALREPTAKKPKPPSTRAAMSDATAQGKFSDAVDALRDKDTKKGCRLLEEIADKAPPNSRWKEKAENLYSRRCD